MGLFKVPPAKQCTKPNCTKRGVGERMSNGPGKLCAPHLNIKK